jgi:hypothetical protein
LSAAGLLRFAYYAWLSKPAGERVLYRAINRRRLRRIVEIGLDSGLRAERMIWAAQRRGRDSVRYTGIDLFETRSSGAAPLGLKATYHRLRSTGARVQLAPGDPFTALARIANSLTGTDLLVISLSGDVDAEALERSWFYIPRMLHAGSQVFAEEESEKGTVFRRLAQLEIERLTVKLQRGHRRAA